MRRSSTKTRNCQTTRTTERGEECLRAADAFLVKSRMRLRIGRRRAARRLFAHLAHRPMLGVPHMQHIRSHSHALLSVWTVRAVELEALLLNVIISVGGNDKCVRSGRSAARAACAPPAAVRRAAGPPGRLRGGHRVGVAFPGGPELLPSYENLAKGQLLPSYAHFLSVTFTVLPRKHTIFSLVCCACRRQPPV
jgi:hypothetical protein